MRVVFEETFPNPAPTTDFTTELDLGLGTSIRLRGVQYTVLNTGLVGQCVLRLGIKSNTGLVQIAGPNIAVGATVLVQHFEGGVIPKEPLTDALVCASALPQIDYHRQLAVRIRFSSAAFQISNVILFWETDD